MSPRGRSLSFLLIALFEAQMRLAPGQAATYNELPLKAENDRAGWTDYIATDAQDATEGRIFVDVPTKKARQLQSSLIRLHNENLMSVPSAKGRHRRYEDFVLKREDARPTGDNSVYRVPEHDQDFFTVPTSLFTNGWIHVLEDSELVLLLIAARFRPPTPLSGLRERRCARTGRPLGQPAAAAMNQSAAHGVGQLVSLAPMYDAGRTGRLDVAYPV